MLTGRLFCRESGQGHMFWNLGNTLGRSNLT